MINDVEMLYMMKLFRWVILIIVVLSFNGCIIYGPNGVPNGGAGIYISEPMILSGVKKSSNKYTYSFPMISENDFLKTEDAGFLLVHSDIYPKLGYIFNVNVKKPFPYDVVWAKAILVNPLDQAKIIYTNHYQNMKGTNIKVTHGPLENVMLNEKYHMKLEVYKDKEFKNLITILKQEIISPVDNTLGCIKLNKELKKENFGYLVDGKKVLSFDHIVIVCGKK